MALVASAIPPPVMLAWPSSVHTAVAPLFQRQRPPMLPHLGLDLPRNVFRVHDRGQRPLRRGRARRCDAVERAQRQQKTTQLARCQRCAKSSRHGAPAGLRRHGHLTGCVGDERRHGEAAPLLVLLDLELAEQQLRGLVVPFGARDREHDHFVAGLVLRASPELEEPSVGQRPSELMKDEVSGDFTLENRERRDAGDRLGAAERVLANRVRNDDAVHDRVGARVRAPDR